MNKKIFYGFLLIFFTLVSGCLQHVQRIWISNPIQNKADNDYFDAHVTAKCYSHGCTGFLLNIKNKTDKDLEVDWNKTLYIIDGQTSGGFMFEGILYRDRNNPKLPDIIFANGELLKAIYPNILVDFTTGSWINFQMMEGENGVYLSVTVDGKTINEKLTVNISSKLIQN